jgi:hypothetical protein
MLLRYSLSKKAVFLEILLVFIAVFGCKKGRTARNVCPIDGEAPQWVGQRNGKSCEYFHYSDIERHSHSWWADCEQNGALPSSQPSKSQPSIKPQ